MKKSDLLGVVLAVVLVARDGVGMWYGEEGCFF